MGTDDDVDAAEMNGPVSVWSAAAATAAAAMMAAAFGAGW